MKTRDTSPAIEVPPSVPTGPDLPHIVISAPEGSQGHLLQAGLVYMGRTIARAETILGDDTMVPLRLRLMTPETHVPHAECLLWLTVNRDPYHSFHPGFGDLYLIERINPAMLKPASGVGRATDWCEQKLSVPENLITVHYHRFDGQYEDAGIWSWDAQEERPPSIPELFSIGADSFGLVFQLDRANYGWPAPSEKIGLLPRLCGDWGQKDGPDRFWHPDLGNEIWLISGDGRTYTSPPDVRPRILAAHIEDSKRILAELSRTPGKKTVRQNQVHLYDAAGEQIPIASIHVRPSQAGRHTTLIDILTEAPLELGNGANLIELEVTGMAARKQATARGVLDDPDLFYDPEATPGCSYTREASIFQVFAPQAATAHVALFTSATESQAPELIPMSAAGKGIWKAQIHGDLEGRFYTYRFSGPLHDPERDITDPCATNTVNSGLRARITDLAACNPSDWDHSKIGPAPAAPQDVIVYEVHVRDFSISPDSGMNHRGGYLAFTEGGTTLPDHPAITTGVDHIADLGVTHVQLMPVHSHEDDETSSQYDWGYMTRAFNSPEGMYASSPFDESRVRELKALVAALHRRGLGVILDVVYNHTAPSATFEATVPGYYFRTLPDGSLANGSGVGNEFRTESPMGRKFLIDSLKFWASEYGVDGFRFDLMALIDNESMRLAERELRAINPHILIYGEPWMAAGSPLSNPTTKHNLRGTLIGAFNDDFRNAIKGSPDHGDPGFIQFAHSREALERGIAGMPGSWPENPAQVINYTTCHDNLVLYDKLKLSMPGLPEAEIIATMRLGYLILLTSQGIPFLHAGEEFARSKGGDSNSYRSPDAVNQIRWALKSTHRDLLRYVRGLIEIRNNHPLFRLRDYSEICHRVRFHHTTRHEAVQCTIDGHDLPGETWTRACILLNGHTTESASIHLPDGAWHIAYDPEGKSYPEICAGKLLLQKKSGAILFSAPTRTQI